MVFHLSSRQSEGLLRSLFALMKLDNDVPDHTTISRRKPKLGKVPFYQVKQKTPLHILIDSSGLAVHAGQLRRAQKSRDYRKLRLGKRKWHTESGYSKRSKVETTFHRYKAIVGSAMRARGLAAQRVEARIGCKILNTMTALRMPDSEMIG